MQCLASRTRSVEALRSKSRLVLAIWNQHYSGSTGHKGLRAVLVLPSWDLDVFEKAYKQNLPVRLPRSREHLPPACSKWFIHDSKPDFDVLGSGNGNDDAINVPTSSELRTSLWSEHEDIFVPLEVTTEKTSSGSVERGHEKFERVEAPMKILLKWLDPLTPAGPGRPEGNTSIYLAQCELSSLPESLQADVPTPSILQPFTSAGIKGDIYASSLWLGRPPTYTPLHRDPNPNLFIQLAGQKTIRLLPPEIGEALYHEISSSLSSDAKSISSRIRGEEMMVGLQKAALHDAVWNDSGVYGKALQDHCLETTLGLGDTLFTPKGWWHSVKGIGDGVTASVNWWFR